MHKLMLGEMSDSFAHLADINKLVITKVRSNVRPNVRSFAQSFISVKAITGLFKIDA